MAKQSNYRLYPVSMVVLMVLLYLSHEYNNMLSVKSQQWHLLLRSAGIGIGNVLMYAAIY